MIVVLFDSREEIERYAKKQVDTKGVSFNRNNNSLFKDGELLEVMAINDTEGARRLKGIRFSGVESKSRRIPNKLFFELKDRS